MSRNGVAITQRRAGKPHLRFAFSSWYYMNARGEVDRLEYGTPAGALPVVFPSCGCRYCADARRARGLQ